MPLDRFSFPSGHTLHAVGFSLVAAAYYPELAPLLSGVTVMVAASRMVLGLHYPSDVLAGATLGAGVAPGVCLEPPTSYSLQQRCQVAVLARQLERRIQVIVVTLQYVSVSIGSQHGPYCCWRAGRAG